MTYLKEKSLVGMFYFIPNSVNKLNGTICTTEITPLMKQLTLLTYSNVKESYQDRKKTKKTQDHHHTCIFVFKYEY